MTVLVIFFFAGIGLWLHERFEVRRETRAERARLAEQHRQESAPDCSHDP